MYKIVYIFYCLHTIPLKSKLNVHHWIKLKKQTISYLKYLLHTNIIYTLVMQMVTNILKVPHIVTFFIVILMKIRHNNFKSHLFINAYKTVGMSFYLVVVNWSIDICTKPNLFVDGSQSSIRAYSALKCNSWRISNI